MPYSPINSGAYTAAYAGAISGMAVSGWITNPNKANYLNETVIAGAFAQAFDIAWNNAAVLNNLELAAITAVIESNFNDRGPGPLSNPTFRDPNNWTIAARACVALILECDDYFTGEGISPGFPSVQVVNVPNLAALTALEATSLNPGSRVVVQSLRRVAVLQASTLPLVSNEVVISSDPTKQWVFEPYPIGAGNPWIELTDCWISPTGNDEADGSSLTPLATLDEWVRRLASSELNTTYLVQFTGPLPNGIVTDLNLGPDGRVFFDLQPAATVELTRTVAAYTAPNDTTEWALVQTVEADDLAGEVGRRIRFTNGPAQNAVAYITESDPGGAGVNVIRIGVPIYQDGSASENPEGVNLVPLAGNTFVIETLAEIGCVTVRAQKQITDESGQSSNSVVIGSARIGSPLAPAPVLFITPLQSAGALYGCNIDAASVIGIGYGVGCRVDGQGADATPLIGNAPSSGEANAVTPVNRCTWNWHSSVFVDGRGFHSVNCRFDQCMWQGGPDEDATLRPQPGYTILTTRNAFFDSGLTGTAIFLQEPCNVRITGPLYSDGLSGYGIHWTGGGIIVQADTVPTISGTTGDTRLMGVVQAWGAYPVVNIGGSGLVYDIA
jgi:hypothetical protein